MVEKSYLFLVSIFFASLPIQWVEIGIGGEFGLKPYYLIGSIIVPFSIYLLVKKNFVHLGRAIFFLAFYVFFLLVLMGGELFRCESVSSIYWRQLQVVFLVFLVVSPLACFDERRSSAVKTYAPVISIFLIALAFFYSVTISPDIRFADVLEALVSLDMDYIVFKVLRDVFLSGGLDLEYAATLKNSIASVIVFLGLMYLSGNAIFKKSTAIFVSVVLLVLIVLNSRSNLAIYVFGLMLVALFQRADVPKNIVILIPFVIPVAAIFLISNVVEIIDSVFLERTESYTLRYNQYMGVFSQGDRAVIWGGSTCTESLGHIVHNFVIDSMSRSGVLGLFLSLSLLIFIIVSSVVNFFSASIGGRGVVAAIFVFVFLRAMVSGSGVFFEVAVIASLFLFVLPSYRKRL